VNQTHYDILKILYDENKTNAVGSMKLKELIDIGKNSGSLLLTQNTVYKQILSLNKKGLIEVGLRMGKENSYYITPLGISIKAKLEGR
jgi:DNA-binding MarR family transcriptional regulator